MNGTTARPSLCWSIISTLGQFGNNYVGPWFGQLGFPKTLQNRLLMKRLVHLGSSLQRSTETKESSLNEARFKSSRDWVGLDWRGLHSAQIGFSQIAYGLKWLGLAWGWMGIVDCRLGWIDVDWIG